MNLTWAEGREGLLTVKPTLPIRSTLRYDCHGSSMALSHDFFLFSYYIWGLFVWLSMNTRLYACFYWIFELLLSLIYLDFGSKIIFICLASFYAFVIIFLFSSFKSSLGFSPPALLSTRIIHEMVLGLKSFFCFVFLLTIHFVLLFVSGKWVWETASGDGC